MSRYSNLYPLLSRLQELAEAIASDTTGEKPVTSSTPAPRVHKLDHRLDGEQIARIVAEYEAGASAAVIGDMFSLSKRSVIKIVREAGVVIWWPRMSHAEIREATRLYAGGLSLVEVGKRLNRDHSTIYKALKRAGVRMRDSHGRD
jgi:DNA-binding CsgD family transcriptional regulator